jgi:predicted PurR-regulated permease PerM
VVTLGRDPDEPVAQPEGKDDLGRRGQQRQDPARRRKSGPLSSLRGHLTSMATSNGPSTATVARVTFTVLGCLLAVYLAYVLRNVLVLVVVAAFLAVGLDPAVRRLERWGVRRGGAVALIFFAAVVFIAAFVAAVIPPLVRQIGTFARDLPGYVQDLSDKNPRVKAWVVDNDIPQRLRDALRDVPGLIAGSLGNVVGIAGSVLAALFNALTVIVLTIYFMLSLSRIREGSLKLVPKSHREQVRDLLDPILEKIGGYIAGQVMVALIAGVLAFAYLLLTGVPFPIALALWVSIAALIPLVGATIGAVPAVVVAFVTSVPLGIATVVYFVVYQQIENYLIAPRIMTRAVDISPAAVLLAALMGGSLLGFVGALMAIPAAAALKLITQEVLLPRAERS